MSTNKMRFYTVSLTNTVRANSQSEAIALVFGEKVQGELLDQEVYAERISADVAHQVVSNQ